MNNVIIHRYGPAPKVEMVSDEITLSDGTTRANTPEARAAYQAERQRFTEALKQRQAALNALNTGRECPLQYEPEQGHGRECKRNCVFHQGNGCAFAVQAATVDTKGGSCPFQYGKPCKAGCAWYNGGCTVTTMSKGE